MRVLVTGAAGRIGLRVVEQLTERQVEVIAADTRPAPASTAARWFHGELVGRPALMDRLVRCVRPDAIVHLAGLAGGGCEQRPAAARARNTVLTQHLAEIAAGLGVRRFVFSSTSAVYHQTTLAPTREGENIGPESVYGRTKLAAEAAIETAAAASRTSFATLRIFNVYGPGMDASLCERLVRSDHGNPVELTGWRNFYRDYLHADEVARALRLAALTPGRAGSHEVLNVASGIARNTADLVAELEGLGARPVYRRAEGRDDPNYSWADIGRAAEAIGYEPRTEIVLS